jgi:hypothetical protein
VEALEHLFARFGQALDGVEDGDVVTDAQVGEQGFVGRLVDAGLKAPQVDGHAVGNLVVHGRQDAFARGHRLVFTHEGRS